MGADRAGARVDGWVFSTPVHLGTHTVSAAGTIRLTLPTTLAAGAHRIAVLDADGAVIGWFSITVRPAALGATGADATATDGGSRSRRCCSQRVRGSWCCAGARRGWSSAAGVKRSCPRRPRLVRVVWAPVSSSPEICVCRAFEEARQGGGAGTTG
ncbi:hypothetical protein GCM10025869_24770 [Homoserinibacter gongjuensis]|uniref:Uncharacterized protein n=1 Tax=Homoserinibacter gongjuensis TaxID=1162968 RepID=A0ABQ6JUH2_9MICO|nr:hypothetical protein GCM10025869_24770 [Homoserinibacter gongjuensis]